MKETLRLERDQFWHNVETIKATEGFGSLSEEQQRMIILSLYVEDRASRFVPPQNLHSDTYELSRVHTIRWFCHGAIYGLENGLSPESNPQERYDPAFFDADYYQIRDKTDATWVIEEFGFPCVVHISTTPNNGGRNNQDHSFLALGHNKSGEIVIWEKAGYAYPYRLTDLETQLEEYGTESYWGVRELRNNPRPERQKPRKFFDWLFS